jgi:hypothetical protein
VKEACTFLATGSARFFPDDLGRQLLEIAQHRHREQEHVDLTLELRLESLERDGVLHVEVRATLDLHGPGGTIERPLQVDRERLVRCLLEAELGRVARFVSARVVVTRSILETSFRSSCGPIRSLASRTPRPRAA